MTTDSQPKPPAQPILVSWILWFAITDGLLLYIPFFARKYDGGAPSGSPFRQS